MHLVRWSDLDFPKEEGLYHFAGMDIWVSKFVIQRANEWIAAGNGDAVFPIAEHKSGPEKYSLGSLYRGRGES
jgi:hypothetical protein